MPGNVMIFLQSGTERAVVANMVAPRRARRPDDRRVPARPRVRARRYDADCAAAGTMDRFAGDVHTIASSLGRPPALVGASLGGLSSLAAVGESRTELATSLVLVDVAPRVETEGRVKIQTFMRGGMRGFDTLEDAADSIAAYLPHRPRPTNLEGLTKNLRQRGDGRWYWHWDPRWLGNNEGVDGQGGLVRHERLCAAARDVTIPTLLVRGRMSDIVSDQSVRELQELIPHAEVVDIADAGHMVAGDKNDVFNEAVIDFVNRTS
jgi:pimeloyl-ACP methyl ester carboxylesterase